MSTRFNEKTVPGGVPGRSANFPVRARSEHPGPAADLRKLLAALAHELESSRYNPAAHFVSL
ncbi:hypothetical protein QMK33_09975 [Hymenobacter sp. H14-R3]|uniref:hypothetical protein n=1 Tax=Hymenobacter sp. H14-R3 TaxID=3046308 RepID=UPI0024BBB889|nr:hypothetical protein [Hymenobacter sp. H14-R3]MDJ0365482.1 hypothetical protein [Hymenobacter sp. H14-R3]